ncbi:protein rolling stone isoform X2 [Nematostella vectensis]|nr:protein rolling stone isoform X2 [Nematostella vectensis]
MRLDQGALWFIFLTNWSYTILNIHFILGACLPAYHYYKCSPGAASSKIIATDSNANDEPANHVQLELEDPCAVNTKLTTLPQNSRMFILACKVSWVVFNIAANVAPLVTFMYWGFNYVPGQYVDSSNINAHALNCVLMFADVMLSNLPVRVLHVIYALVCGFAYVTFTVIYWAAGGVNHEGNSYIYSALDYTGSPGMAATMAVLFVLLAQPLSHLLLYGLYCFRDWLVKRSTRAIE